MIGLVDFDLQQSTSTSLLVPNLEIMKLATYYQNDKNTFCRLIDLNETELSSYEKIYFFSETSEDIRIPEQFLRAHNVIYGGTAFTKGVYIPFKDDLIDFTIARPNIYKEFLKNKYQDGIKAKVISHVLDDAYYRMYAGDQRLPIPPIRRTKRIFIYDRDFLHGDWQEIIQQISERKPSSIVPIHPILCHTVTDFLKLRAEPKISRNSTIILDLNIPLDEIHYLLKKYKKIFLAEITPSSSICLSLGGSFNSSFQYFKDFIYKMNLLYSLWCHDIPIKLIYIKPELGYIDALSDLSQFTVNWTNSPTHNNKTLYDRMHFRAPKQTIENIKQQYELLLKFHPQSKILFLQNYDELKQRGYWRL